MTLAFSTILDKIPTFFVEKIHIGLLKQNLVDYQTFVSIVDKYYKTFTHYEKPKSHVMPKIHTIREDQFDRWKAGNKIHFTINNRQPSVFQFAPILKCVSVQKITITYWFNPKTQKFDTPIVIVKGKELKKKEIELLAVNDGFENSKAFFAYFKENFTGKIIHWTDYKY